MNRGAAVWLGPFILLLADISPVGTGVQTQVQVPVWILLATLQIAEKGHLEGTCTNNLQHEYKTMQLQNPIHIET